MPLNTVLFSLAFIVFGAIAFYPVYMFAVFFLDYVYGGRVLWQSLVYESGSHTIGLLQSDWSRALPVGAAVCGPLLLAELLRTRWAGNTLIWVVFATLIVTIVLIFHLLGFDGAQLIPAGFATLVLALGSRLASRYFRVHP